jgi:protein-disulfide isomerase
MFNRPARAQLIPVFLLTGTIFLFAQDWQNATELNGVDLTRLTGAQKTRALHALRTQECTCGCGMKIAECRVKDPGCAYSRGLSAALVESLTKGKSEAAAVADMKASKYATRPEPKLLEDPVAIPIDGSPVIGPANAPITLVEFSDFQCPYCSKAVLKISGILKAFPKDVKLVFKQYPLDSHPQALISAQAAIAAHQQGKFWQLHDLMFANRTSLSRKAILGWAASVGLDMKRFEADIDSDPVKKAVARDIMDGDKAGVEGTPTVYINGRRYNGELAIEASRPVIEAELKRLATAKK